jgi:hypothetical protein
MSCLLVVGAAFSVLETGGALDVGAALVVVIIILSHYFYVVSNI